MPAADTCVATNPAKSPDLSGRGSSSVFGRLARSASIGNEHGSAAEVRDVLGVAEPALWCHVHAWQNR